jgi:hypothetical protein
MRHLVFLFVCCHAVCSFGQQLSSQQFDISYSPAGLSSIKHVHDAYDTDYVMYGRTLGDVVLRYRATGETLEASFERKHPNRSH